MRQRGRVFQQPFWQATSLDSVAQQLSGQQLLDPFSRLAWQSLLARRQHTLIEPAWLASAGGMADVVSRQMQRAIDDETTRLENGLTLLASVAAVAPFVGLFGTVWGAYHALTAIGSSGVAGLEQIAGPGYGRSVLRPGRHNDLIKDQCKRRRMRLLCFTCR